MGDMGDDFAALRAHTQARHAVWKEQNTATLQASDHVFRVTNYGETLLFREAGKPKVDFYPSSGRWRIPGQTHTFSGGAEAFLKWYSEQKGKHDEHGITR